MLFLTLTQQREKIKHKKACQLTSILFLLECHGAHHLCSHRGEPVLKNSGHHVRAKTNQPIIGVLTQPLPSEWNNDLELTYKSFFESSHADFLQAAGARVVPIDYT